MRIGISALAILLIVLAASCLWRSGTGSVEAATFPRNGINIALTSDIRSTNPGVNRDANTDTVMMHIVEGLVAYREDGTVGPLLARSVEKSEDGKVYTFRLRPGIRFHNGKVLTAADVVWTWKRYLAPDTGWSCLSDFDGTHGNAIESVVATDGETVVFTLNRPQPLFLMNMARIDCGGGGILHPSSVNPDGSWHGPVATGPYMLGEWKHGQYILLNAFTGYQSRPGPRDGNTGGKIAFAPVLRWMIIRDAAARLAALANDQVQAMPEVPSAETVQLRRFPGVKITAHPMLTNYALLIQSDDPLFSDIRMRHALALAIDRTELTKLVTNGAGVANPSAIPSSSTYYSAAQQRGADFNVAKARDLLAQAGYHGQPIAMITNRRYPAMFNQALLTQAMARAAGINIKLEVLEWAAQMDLWKSGKFQLMSFGFSARADPYLNYQGILGDRKTNPNKIWHDQAAVDLEDAADRTDDPAVRQKLFDRMHALMIRDCPLIVLYTLADVNAVRGSLEGFDSWVLGRARFWGVRRMTEKQAL